MRSSGFTAVVLAMLVAGCGDKPQTTQPDAAKTADALKGIRIEPGRKGAEMGRMLSVQGRWTGKALARHPGQHLELDVAGTSEYTLDLVGEEDGRPAIYATSRGRISWRDDGVMEGRGDAKGLLAPYARWAAGFPTKDDMMLRSGRGDETLKRASTS